MAVAPGPDGPKRLRVGLTVIALLALAAVLAGGYLTLHHAPPATVASLPSSLIPAPPVAVAPVPAPPVTAPPVAVPPAAPHFTTRTAGEASIAANVPTTLTLFRFAANPKVLVLDFPTLLQQGEMLNRIAAMVEKRGLPHDRVLTDSQLDAAIKLHGDTVSTYYYGHDYPAADLARFFKQADRQGVKLGPQEELLRQILTDQGFLVPGSQQALISIPRVDSAPGIDAVMRASILEHELSHGEFFSDPAYAAYTRRFYTTILPEAARNAFRTFLISQEYDPSVPDLIANETQAYLMNTSDPRLFNAAEVGMTDAQLHTLRESFFAGMPPGWLRDRIARKLAPAASAHR